MIDRLDYIVKVEGLNKMEVSATEVTIKGDLVVFKQEHIEIFNVPISKLQYYALKDKFKI